MAYKIVQYHDGKYLSFNNRNSKYCIEYKENEWAYPSITNSLLFIFKDLDMAISFLYQCGFEKGMEFIIFECEVGEVFTPLNPVSDYLDSCLEQYWADTKDKEKWTKTVCGSYGTEKLKLLTQVW